MGMVQWDRKERGRERKGEDKMKACSLSKARLTLGTRWDAQPVMSHSYLAHFAYVISTNNHTATSVLSIYSELC